MRLKSSYLVVLATMSLPTMPAMAIQVPFLTGTWEGKLVCSGVKHLTSKAKTTFKSKLYITQNSNTLSINRVDDAAAIDAYPVDYTGFVLSDPKKPTIKGQVAVSHCASSNDVVNGGYSEMSNFSVTADYEKAKGTLKGTSIYSHPSSIGMEVGDCKWQFKLIDPTDPLISPSCL